MNNPNYPECLKLKELGLPQTSGKDYCAICQKRHERFDDHKECADKAGVTLYKVPTVSIPTLAQMIAWLESLEVEVRLTYLKTWYINIDDPYFVIENPDLLSALIALYIELKEK